MSLSKTKLAEIETKKVKTRIHEKVIKLLRLLDENGVATLEGFLDNLSAPYADLGPLRRPFQVRTLEEAAEDVRPLLMDLNSELIQPKSLYNQIITICLGVQPGVVVEKAHTYDDAKKEFTVTWEPDMLFQQHFAVECIYKADAATKSEAVSKCVLQLLKDVKNQLPPPEEEEEEQQAQADEDVDRNHQQPSE